jgi:serine/threonine protein kinase/Tol biopolymer transport system component
VREPFHYSVQQDGVKLGESGGTIVTFSGCAVADVKAPQGIARFEGFTLDLRAGELCRDGGKTVRLPEQSFRILLLLLEHPREVITREELRKTLWPNDTIVEFEHSIGAAMNRLRQALGDSAENPRYIETLARRGYRWKLPVEWAELSRAQQAPVVVALAQTKSMGESLIGKLVSHYRVLEVLGGGGMGIVYQAEDIKLGRRVALKFLPEELSSERVMRERFEREARATSSLDHPNICAIYEVEEHEGKPFIVMQLLDGQTLRERINSGTRLTSDEVLDIALQIVEGLDAAHNKGIIHRDIKPANIFLTKRGEAKILDFGLAKLELIGALLTSEIEHLEGCRGSILDTPTVSYADLNLTKAGERIGTACYMSPEQVRGERLDARTDLFSLGLVIYEMATSQQAFPGKTASVVHNAILYGTPPPAGDLNPELPPKLADIITKCLEKNRESRYQSAADLRTELKGLKQESQSGGVTAAAVTSRTAKRKWALLVIALVMVAGVTAWQSFQARVPKVIGSIQITNDGLPKSDLVTEGARLYFQEAVAGWPALVQVSVKGGSLSRIDVPLQRPEIYDVSPSGSELLVSSGGPGLDLEVQLWVLPLPAGAPYRVGDILAHAAGWAPDGLHIVYANGYDLYRARADGSEIRKLVTTNGVPYWIRFSPDGRRLRFSVDDRIRHMSSLWEVTADGKGLRRLLTGWSNVPNECCGSWSHDGKYYYFQANRQDGQNIWVLGEGIRILRGSGSTPVQLTTGPLAFREPVPSTDGKRLFVIAEQKRVELVRFESSTKQFMPYLGGISAGEVDVSRDREWVAYVAYPSSTLWRSKSDGSERVQLTFAPMEAHEPRWSPDGKQIVFSGMEPGKPLKLFLISSQGSTPREVIPGDKLDELDPTWMPDGRSIVFGRWHASDRAILWVDLKTHQVSKLPLSDRIFSPRVSPDGRFVAAFRTDGSGLLLYDFGTAQWSELAHGEFGFNNWSHDGKYVYMLHALEGQRVELDRVTVADVKLEHLFDLTDFPQGSDVFSDWMGLGPDDSPLLMRDRSTQETYALDLQLP